MNGRCRICGRWADLECHHVFGGHNRAASERYGLKVMICRECHDRIHFGGKDGERLKNDLRKEFQAWFQERNPDLDFPSIFHVNYLDGEEDKEQETLDLI